MTPGVHPIGPGLARRIGSTLFRLCAFGLLAGLTAMALIVLPGFQNQYADLVAQFTVPAAVSACAVAALLALLRRWRWVGAAALPVILLMAAAWPQALPQRSVPRPGAPTLTVYSANLFVRNGDVEAIAASIRQADADVVMLIELGDRTAPYLDRLIPDYPYRLASGRFDRPNSGVRSVIASRYPLTPLPRADEVEAVAALARTPLGPVNLVNVHLTRPWPFEESWGQISQTHALSLLVGRLQGPVIVAGDFNSVSSARIGRQVQTSMGLRPAPGFPGTWPSALPSPLAITIDQVYASPDLAFADRRLGRRNGSDHRPVITEITLAE